MALGSKDVLSIASFTGGVVSSLSSLFIVISYLAFPKLRIGLRQKIIFGLAISDFVNYLNNAVSGVMVLTNGSIEDGVFCKANGFIGQMMTISSDYAILLTCLLTYLTISKNSLLSSLQSSRSGFRAFLILSLPWLTSIGMAIGGLIWVGYAYNEDANWCSLIDKPWQVRYVLSYGHRFIIMIIISLIYTTLYLKMKVQKSILSDSLSYISSSSGSSNPSNRSDITLHVEDSPSIGPRMGTINSSLSSTSSAKLGLPLLVHNQLAHLKQSERQAKKLRHAMMLLMLYPLIYFLLWLPQMISLILSLAGTKVSLLAYIGSATTQFLGFANALLYGWNHNLKKQLRS